MNTEKIATDKCPNCNGQVKIPEGWATFRDDRIISIDADWRCPDCDEIGKMEIGGLADDHWRP